MDLSEVRGGMKTKRKGLKFLSIFLIALLCCGFLSRTILTIVTPKVQLVVPSRGSLEDKIELEGSIQFSNAELIFIPEAFNMNITINQVLVKPGSYINKGDVLFTSYIPSYDSIIKKQEKNYADAVRAYAQTYLNDLRISHTSAHNDVYNDALKAIDIFYQWRLDVLSISDESGKALHDELMGFELNDRWMEALKKGKQDTRSVPDGIMEHITSNPQNAASAYNSMISKLRELWNINQGKSTIKRIGEKPFGMIRKLDALKEEIYNRQEEILEVKKTAASLEKIVAPFDGYICDVFIKEGDAYDGTKAAYRIAKKDMRPLVRVDISKTDRRVKRGMIAKIAGSQYDETVSDVVLNGDGTEYAFISLSEETIVDLGGLRKALAEKFKVMLLYRADRMTTLLPASCIRTDNDDSYYVYSLLTQEGGILSADNYKLEKYPITILEKSNQYVSIEEDLTGILIADSEDRIIKSGQVVMEYAD